METEDKNSVECYLFRKTAMLNKMPGYRVKMLPALAKNLMDVVKMADGDELYKKNPVQMACLAPEAMADIPYSIVNRALKAYDHIVQAQAYLEPLVKYLTGVYDADRCITESDRALDELKNQLHPDPPIDYEYYRTAVSIL